MFISLNMRAYGFILFLFLFGCCRCPCWSNSMRPSLIFTFFSQFPSVLRIPFSPPGPSLGVHGVIKYKFKASTKNTTSLKKALCVVKGRKTVKLKAHRRWHYWCCLCFLLIKLWFCLVGFLQVVLFNTEWKHTQQFAGWLSPVGSLFFPPFLFFFFSFRTKLSFPSLGEKKRKNEKSFVRSLQLF